MSIQKRQVMLIVVDEESTVIRNLHFTVMDDENDEINSLFMLAIRGILVRLDDDNDWLKNCTPVLFSDMTYYITKAANVDFLKTLWRAI